MLRKPDIQRVFYKASKIENVKLVYPSKGEQKDYPYLLPAHNFEHTYLREDGSLIYKVNYTLDGAGYRNPLKKTRSYQKHILLMGCSWTFGLGLPPEETLSYNLQKIIPDYHSYNLAMNGSGPHDHLFLLEKYPLSRYVTESEGVMVYVFFSDQFRRANSAPSYLDWAEKGRPFYKMVSETLVYKGKIGESSEYLEYQKFKQNGLARSYIESHQLTSSSDKEVKLFVELILRIKKNYLEQFPKGKFVFGLIPYADPKSSVVKKMLKSLAANKVDIIPIKAMENDFKENLQEGEISRYLIKDDGHPSGLANKKFSSHLAKWLQVNRFL